jgi:hypothetical protein
MRFHHEERPDSLVDASRNLLDILGEEGYA